ncbi:hypothetical protein [Spirilliplanes yamanashiensis]|uniref:hypothetical protein n=1 Tax=Spirilliplanes yamanashiensis TaxID=42233 RepID=UPI001952855B|nr:hypothetical protein [Spirilliplanes yamanashiensis]MDP9816280.1 hypothetical protein [Spirilliplanes yamanashiensis]
MRRIVVVVCLLVVLAASALWRQSFAAFSATVSATGSLSAASQFVTCVARTMTPVWMSGFEGGVLTTGGNGFFNIINGGGSTLDTAAPRTGAYALRIVDASASGSQQYVATTIAVTKTLVTRFAIRLNALPSGDVAQLAEFVNDAGQTRSGQLGYNAAAQRFTFGYGSGTKQLSSMTVTAGTWYVVDARMNTTANPNVADWAVDGVAQTQATYAGTSGNFFTLRWGGNTSGDMFDIRFDDIVVDTDTANYPIGPGGIHRLAPDSVTAVTDANGYLQNDDSTAVTGASWDRLDDVPMSTMTDFVKQTAVDANAYLEVGLQNTAQPGCVNAVQGLLSVRSSATQANSAKVSLFDDATERVVLSGDMSPGTSAGQYKATPVAAGSGPWTVAKLNALRARMGYATAMGGQPYFDAVFVEADISS